MEQVPDPGAEVRIKPPRSQVLKYVFEKVGYSGRCKSFFTQC